MLGGVGRGVGGGSAVSEPLETLGSGHGGGWAALGTERKAESSMAEPALGGEGFG